MANLNTKTLSAGVGDILCVDGGISGDKQIKDGDGTASNLYIDGTNLGIGFATPSTMLVVDRGASDGGVVDIITSDNRNKDIRFVESDGTEKGRIRFHDNTGGDASDRLELGTSSDFDALVVTNGKVGIGDTSPTHKLEVAGGIKMGSTNETADYNAHTVILSDSGTAYEGGLLMTNTDTASASYSSIKLNATGAGGSGTADLHIGVVDNNAPNTFIRQHMHLDGSSGNVNLLAGKLGVGTASPSRMLHTVGSTYDGTGGYRLEDDGTGTHHSAISMYAHPIKTAVQIPVSGTMDIELTGGSFYGMLAGEDGMHICFSGYCGSSNITTIQSWNAVVCAMTAVSGEKKIRLTNNDATPNHAVGFIWTSAGVCKIVAQST